MPIPMDSTLDELVLSHQAIVNANAQSSEGSLCIVCQTVDFGDVLQFKRFKKAPWKQQGFRSYHHIRSHQECPFCPLTFKAFKIILHLPHINSM